MLDPDVEKTLPSPRATPRMLVVFVPRLVFHLIAPVRPSTAKTFCWVLWTYSTPSWTTAVLCCGWLVLPPSRLTCQAPPSRVIVRLLIWLRFEWLVLPRSPQTLGKSFPGRPKPAGCNGGAAGAAPAGVPATAVAPPVPTAPAAPARNLRLSIAVPVSRQMQNGRLPMADRMPLTMCFLKKACPT